MTLQRHIRRGTPSGQAQQKADKARMGGRKSVKHCVLANEEKKAVSSSKKKAPKEHLQNHPSQYVGKSRRMGPGDGTY